MISTAWNQVGCQDEQQLNYAARLLASNDGLVCLLENSSMSHFVDSNQPSSDSRFERSLRVIYADVDTAMDDDTPDETFDKWFLEWNEQSQRIEEQLRFIEAQLSDDEWKAPPTPQFTVIADTNQ